MCCCLAAACTRGTGQRTCLQCCWMVAVPLSNQAQAVTHACHGADQRVAVPALDEQPIKHLARRDSNKLASGHPSNTACTTANSPALNTVCSICTEPIDQLSTSVSLQQRVVRARLARIQQVCAKEEDVAAYLGFHRFCGQSDEIHREMIPTVFVFHRTCEHTCRITMRPPAGITRCTLLKNTRIR
jgi:hypothetical protein